ncbi:MAG TPA: lipocalin-like domain-containing protein [Nitrococcus sp.]|nr:lipocalin-like domain-containing protein [Nitrococcus sp.]
MRYLFYALGLSILIGVGVGWWQFAAGTTNNHQQLATNATAFRAPEGNKMDMAGYARVTGPRPMHFPQDHGAHPDYRIEWWYFTGNLTTAQGRPFGFELTFFRFAMAPESVPRASDWATRQLWVANLAISDIEPQRFHFFKRSERGAVGLAGAQIDPVRIWIDNWEVRALSKNTLFPAELQAKQEDSGIDLRLTNDKPLVLQGDKGYSRKSADPGNASYYYSYTRLQAQGTLTLAGESYPVSGTAWMDREWSTSSLAADQAGWDWLCLQLDDGRDLMLYRLRQRDGSADPHSAGVLVNKAGKPHYLKATDFTMTPLRYWRSEATGVTYPVDWAVQVPAEHLDLQVKARMPNQELDLRVRYWEGAVSASGDDVSGRGYLELTGYGSAGHPGAPTGG